MSKETRNFTIVVGVISLIIAALNVFIEGTMHSETVYYALGYIVAMSVTARLFKGSDQFLYLSIAQLALLVVLMLTFGLNIESGLGYYFGYKPDFSILYAVLIYAALAFFGIKTFDPEDDNKSTTMAALYYIGAITAQVVFILIIIF